MAEGKCRKGPFLPIEDYGVIGNMLTVALVSKQDASIDHLCFPHFDSPLIFGRMLTESGGGYYQIAPDTCGQWTTKQLYHPSSNVLVTRFLGAAGGIGQVTDFLPVTHSKEVGLQAGGSLVDELIRTKTFSKKENVFNNDKNINRNNRSVASKVEGWPWIVRKVETVRGNIKFRLQCQPAFDYGRKGHAVREGERKNEMIFESLDQKNSLKLEAFTQFSHHALNWQVCDESSSSLSLPLPRVDCLFELGEHESIYFLLRQGSDDREATSDLLPILLQKTNQYWHDWISKCSYKGRWRETVHRSALVLKLMTFAPTGAIIAAPTLSLPERVGAGMNWDYRFTWIRDAAFTVYAFLRIGFTEEAGDFMLWIEDRCKELKDDDPVGLRLMYDVHGCHPTITVADDTFNEGSVLAGEVELTHWTGYRHSKPVRMGNLAAFQQQLDIYGELMDAIYLCDKWVRPISYEFWQILKEKIIPHVIARWRDPDHGIWESRGTPKHHVYSKVMAWVALDRAIRLSKKHSLPADHVGWIRERDAIYEDVMRGGWNDEIGAFTQFYGATTLDASNLIMPLVFFLPASDPRFLSTLKRTLLPPKLGGLTVNHLVFRFHPQSGEETEGTFSICSFWLVEALARAGETVLLEEARAMFEDIIGYANHLGLFAEEIGLDGSALGNFPQAFTHLSLISAAFNLNRALGE